MCSYEIFDILFADFKNKFEGGDWVFREKYVVDEQQIRIYHVEENRVDVTMALDFPNELQEKYAYHNNWSPFCFKMFEAENSICVVWKKTKNNVWRVL